MTVERGLYPKDEPIHETQVPVLLFNADLCLFNLIL